MSTEASEWIAQVIPLRPKTPTVVDGDLSISIEVVPAGKPHAVVSLSNAFAKGQSPWDVIFDEEVEVRRLSYEGGEWMTDSCQELYQMKPALDLLQTMSEPELLIGGLGLGVFTHLATEFAGSVATTVERDHRIVKYVAPYTARAVIIADIYDVAKHVEPGQYDVAFFDTWQMTGEHCWVNEVVPLRRLIGEKIPHVLCWNEDEMIGQVYHHAFRSMCVPVERLPITDVHTRTLRQRAMDLGCTVTVGAIEVAELLEAEKCVRGNQAASTLVERFVTNVGSSEWEAEFGALWDRNAEQYHQWQRKTSHV